MDTTEHESGPKRRGFFFDRDGVVNRDPHPEPYVLSWDQWNWTPGIFELLRAVKDAGFVTILVTSQKGVGKGLMSQTDLDGIHDRMQAELRAEGLEFDAIYAYTGLPECPNQPKPDPQMILAAAEAYDLDLAQSWLIGDADRDLEMAQRAGISRTIRVRGLKPIGVHSTHAIASLAEAIDLAIPNS